MKGAYKSANDAFDSMDQVGARGGGGGCEILTIFRASYSELTVWELEQILQF